MCQWPALTASGRCGTQALGAVVSGSGTSSICAASIRRSAWRSSWKQRVAEEVECVILLRGVRQQLQRHLQRVRQVLPHDRCLWQVRVAALDRRAQARVPPQVGARVDRRQADAAGVAAAAPVSLDVARDPDLLVPAELSEPPQRRALQRRGRAVERARRGGRPPRRPRTGAGCGCGRRSGPVTATRARRGASSPGRRGLWRASASWTGQG